VDITGVDGTYCICLPIRNNQNIDSEENMMGDGERKLKATLQSWCWIRRSMKQHNHKVQAFTIKSGSGGKVAKDNKPPCSISQVRDIGKTCLQQRPYKKAAKTSDRDHFINYKQHQVHLDASSQVQSKQQTRADIESARQNLKNLSQEIKWKTKNCVKKRLTGGKN